MRVITRKRGFYGGQLREKGSVFEVPEGETAPWFAPIPEAPAAPELTPVPETPVKAAGKPGKAKG
jgi:hypothetical protein